MIPTGCGSSEDDPPPTDPQDDGHGAEAGDGGRGGTSSGSGGATGGSSNGGSSGSGEGGSGNEGGDGPDVDELAPVVTITSPEDLSHPDDGTVLVEPTVTVVCRAEQSPESGSEPVDRGKVTLTMIGPDGETTSTVQETGVDEFSAEFIVTDLPNGAVAFECSASDSSSTPRVGTHRISTFIDHGPAIEIIEPLEDSAHALGLVSFLFKVEPDPLVDDDAGAAVDSVTLRVEDQDIDLDEQAPGEFHADVNFNDTMLFPDPGATVAVVITARNARMPARGERVYPYFFTLDSEGPTIEVITPGDEDVVGGEVVLRFTVIDDLSTVDERSVYVTFNDGDPVYFDPENGWTRTGDEFALRFDTTAIEGSISQANINIEAKDQAGNDADGESLLLYLDNVAPTVDLDPPLVREYKVTGADTLCSNAFDPVGSAASSDLQQVGRFGNVLRAFVWERTNPATFRHHAGVDRESVFVFLQPDRASPILLDTDDDGECDEIAPDLPFSHLGAVNPIGSAVYGPSNGDPANAPPIPPSFCIYGEDADGEPRLCTPPSSDMTRVLSWDFDSTVPVLYGIGLLDPGPGCTGIDWDIGATVGIQEGWVCLAARAVDNVGNVGVSKPLRLCYDDGVGAPADCSGTPPLCSEGCTVSPSNSFPPNQILLDPP